MKKIISRKYSTAYSQWLGENILRKPPQKPPDASDTPAKAAIVPGNAMIDIAKIIGITPADATLIGICVL